MARIMYLFMLLLTLASCAPESTRVDGFQIPEIVYPKDNPSSDAKIELGRRLFFEKALSIDSSISCGSCHKPALSFADSVALSDGVMGRKPFRNTPSIINAGFLPYFMMEGGVKSLELQVLAPLQDHNEMALHVFEACKRLNADSSYSRQFDLVWGDSATPFTLTRSIASFERELIIFNSAFDEYLEGDSLALSESARRGKDLFYSDRTDCSSCHTGRLLTNFEIKNNGLAKVYEDKGLFRLTTKDEDAGKFKIPSLRNVKHTAPYMHDGSLTSLKAVLNHYNRGGMGHPNQDPLVRPLDLSENELEDLIAFLRSL